MPELQTVEPYYDPSEHYPPKGTEEACLAIVIDGCNFHVLGHTGRFMHGQINCAGYNGEEIGLGDVPDEPGFWVMERGQVWTHTDWETGIQDDSGCDGDWRPATPADFARFEVPLPACFASVDRCGAAGETREAGLDPKDESATRSEAKGDAHAE